MVTGNSLRKISLLKDVFGKEGGGRQQLPPGICPTQASSLDFIDGLVHAVQISTGNMNSDL